jgi:hypothetical protein
MPLLAVTNLLNIICDTVNIIAGVQASFHCTGKPDE